MNRKMYWMCFIAIWIVEILLLVYKRDITREIPRWRLVALIALLVVYMVVILLRLKDIGYNLIYALLCFIVPIFAIYIGVLPRKERASSMLQQEKESQHKQIE